MITIGADLIVYPGAFNMTTGPLHWELLLRARAVDNQVSKSDGLFMFSLINCIQILKLLKFIINWLKREFCR